MWIFLWTFVFAAHAQISAHRYSDETYAQARARALHDSAFQSQALLGSAEAEAVPFNKLNLQIIPKWNSERMSFQKAFETVRDERFLTSKAHKDFPRRPTWLYPDDGCYARAEVSIRRLQEKTASPAGKVFAFGQLQVETDNSPHGVVSWWYHVAPIFQYQNQAMVWDAAIEPLHPISLEDWIQRMGSLRGIRIAICDTHTYDPDDSCSKPRQLTNENLIEQQRSFLSYEWQRLIDLRRDPKVDLGDFPPWKK